MIIQTIAKCWKSTISARKYLRSISQTALHYKPNTIRPFTGQQNIKDRVVQVFFDASLQQIQVSQSFNRLLDVKNFSTPSHSFYQIKLPFSKNLHLRKKMIQFYNNNIRIGRIMELKDYIAANVAYRYCTPQKAQQLAMDELDFIVVTAAIDQIDFYTPVQADLDCTLFGYVCYVGKSSMQIQIDVMQKINGIQRLNCTAKFVMVARNKQTGKAYLVPPLNIDSQPQIFKFIYELGQKRQLNRKQQAKRQLKITPPSYQQFSLIHKIMLETQNKTQNWIPMSKTKQSNTLLMHFQDKNLSGKIFGGYIIRLAYELGWLCAHKFLNSFPKTTHIDDVQFLAPVEIGTAQDFQAVVSYVNQMQRLVHVVVKCKNTKNTGENVMTNILRITFQYEEGTTNLKVYPQTLSETMAYIESMRRVNKYLGG